MADGILIAESVRIGTPVEGVPLRVDKVSRADVGDESVGQPRIWTFIAFEAPDEDAESLAEVLSEALEPVGGWYCDFRTAEDTFVVFGGRSFRYGRGDREARTEVEAYARSVGVPEAQVDWRE